MNGTSGKERGGERENSSRRYLIQELMVSLNTGVVLGRASAKSERFRREPHGKYIACPMASYAA